MTTVLGYEGQWFKSSAVPICYSWERHFIRIASTEGISSWRVFDQCYEPSRLKKNQCIYISVYSETIKSSNNKGKKLMLWQSDYNHGHKRNALKLLQYHPYMHTYVHICIYRYRHIYLIKAHLYVRTKIIIYYFITLKSQITTAMIQK